MFALARAELRARYGRGYFQLVKWLLDPFAVLGVYMLLVTFVIDRPVPDAGLSLACAIVPFQLVMSSVISGLSAIDTRRAVITNMAFPRNLIPVSVALTESVAFLASLVLLALMMAIYGVAPTPALLWLPVVLGVNLCLAMAFAFPATLVGVWFPDMRVFAVSIVRTMYFLAPGLVPLSAASHRAQDVLRINPFTGLFESYRSMLVSGASPSAWMIIVPLGWAVLLAALFVPVYRREQRQFAKVLG
jgi:lipopolysaccharide transport system permease protein